MAIKNKSYCRQSGCNRLTRDTYCEAHLAGMPGGSSASRLPFYDSKEWVQLREGYRLRHPLCERCEANGVTKVAEHVHHVKPVREYPELALDPDNLQSLCRQCHDDAEAEAARSKAATKPYDFGKGKRQRHRPIVMKGRR